MMFKAKPKVELAGICSICGKLQKRPKKMSPNKWFLILKSSTASFCWECMNKPLITIVMIAEYLKELHKENNYEALKHVEPAFLKIVERAIKETT